MKKGHFDSKTGGNDLFQKSETESLGLAINEWQPKKTYKRNVSVPTYPQKFDRIRLIFDEAKKA